MKLPNAPLVEVIFEMQWDIPAAGPFFKYDPGFEVFLSKFAKEAAALGYTSHQALEVEPPFGNKATDRFRMREPFPILQIGHGLFACNISTDYEWSRFRGLIEEGIGAVERSYPTNMRPLQPSRLELRYIDVFNTELLSHSSFTRFIKEATTLKINNLGIFDDCDAANDIGSLNYRVDRGPDVGVFDYQLASGAANDVQSILLTSRVIKSAVGMGSPLKANVLKWADAAHDTTSKFFTNFVSKKLMKKFQSENEGNRK